MAMRSDGASMGREYLRLLRHVLERGARKDDRTRTGALSPFGYQMRFDLSARFPLLTAKRIHLSPSSTSCSGSCAAEQALDAPARLAPIDGAFDLDRHLTSQKA